MSKTTDKGDRSEVARAIHEMMSDAHDAGVISRATLLDIDDASPNRASMLAVVRASAAPKAKAGPNAASSQDFLYGEDGLPD
jgi:hypothetical protein